VLVDLGSVLREQRQVGHRITDITIKLLFTRCLRTLKITLKLTHSLSRFIRMYNPHEAREDTVLFPALRKITSSSEYDSLGEDFEEK